MKKSRFTESQVVAILQEGEAGVAVAQLARKHGISPATYYHWKSKYAGAGVPELKRLRELEAENAKLKRMYADLGTGHRAALHPAGEARPERLHRALQSTLREEVLSAYLFESLDQVRDITDDWLEQYNQIRPHDALGSLPPARYRERLLAGPTPV